MNPRRSEYGTALVICLVLLTTLSLLAVATMRTATLEMTVARNSQSVARAFESAEAGLETAIERIDSGRLALVAEDDWRQSGALIGRFGGAGDEFTINLRYMGRNETTTWNMKEPVIQNFEIESIGRARNAVSAQTRGIAVVKIGEQPIQLTYWFRNQAPQESNRRN
jgi:Tfp pilus assembly protein PilX